MPPLLQPTFLICAAYGVNWTTLQIQNNAIVASTLIDEQKSSYLMR